MTLTILGRFPIKGLIEAPRISSESNHHLARQQIVVADTSHDHWMIFKSLASTYFYETNKGTDALVQVF
jgi:hypothetical protein